MTINHIFFNASAATFQALRSFYEVMICANNDALIGYGSDFPYFWLRKLSEGQTPLPTHIAFDAPNREALDQFYEIAFRQPYYAAFVSDIDGNNVEAVCVSK
ncbi:hypothetical protein EAF00_007371 [Botryotinia globosa]|nr:hypothetical protein EAF00_007371 [Botryotinia globosa]